MKKLWCMIFLILIWAVPAHPDTYINGQVQGGGGLPACSDADYTTGTSTTCAGTPANAKVELDKKVPIPTASIDDGLLLVKDGTGTTGKFKAGGVPITMTSDTTGPKYYDTTADTWESGSYARTPVIDDPDNFAANFTGANLYGGTFIANAAGTAALPDPAAGMNFTIVLEGANAVIIDPLGTGTADTIVMNGLAAAADENITSSTSGAMCVFQYRAANSWMATCNGFAEATPP